MTALDRAASLVHDATCRDNQHDGPEDQYPCVQLVREVLKAGQPKPHVVQTVEDVYRLFEDGSEPFAVRDRLGMLWLIWDIDGEDVYATSWPEDDQQDSRDAVHIEAIPGVTLPATVLTAQSTVNVEQYQAAVKEAASVAEVSDAHAALVVASAFSAAGLTVAGGE